MFIIETRLAPLDLRVRDTPYVVVPGERSPHLCRWHDQGPRRASCSRGAHPIVRAGDQREDGSVVKAIVPGRTPQDGMVSEDRWRIRSRWWASSPEAFESGFDGGQFALRSEGRLLRLAVRLGYGWLTQRPLEEFGQGSRRARGRRASPTSR